MTPTLSLLAPSSISWSLCPLPVDAEILFVNSSVIPFYLIGDGIKQRRCLYLAYSKILSSLELGCENEEVCYGVTLPTNIPVSVTMMTKKVMVHDADLTGFWH